MPPRKVPLPCGTFASHSKHLQQRLPRRRFASTLARPGESIWRGHQDPFTRVGQSITGGMEWQTSTYHWNEQNTKPLPVAATNVEKLIEAFITMKVVNNEGEDIRAIRTALAARRKSADKMYVSKPRIKDFGERIELTAFVYDGIEAARKAFEQRAASRGGKVPSSNRNAKTIGSGLVLDPQQQTGLQGLIARIYGKPVTLKLVKLNQPHLDADILAAVVAQRLRDRRNTPRRVIRDVTWKAPLPKMEAVALIQQKKAQRQAVKFAWSDFTVGNLEKTTNATLKDKLSASQVTSVQVQAAGRLTKRLTANRSAKKMARSGANAKGPAYMLRGFRKAHVQKAFGWGKRRVGQFGIQVSLGHA